MKEKRQAASPKSSDALLTELRGLIDAARQHVAQAANATLTMLYWHVGQRIQKEVLQEQRAEYGEEIVSMLSTQLAREYGQGFGLRSLRRMVPIHQQAPSNAQETDEVSPVTHRPNAVSQDLTPIADPNSSRFQGQTSSSFTSRPRARAALNTVSS